MLYDLGARDLESAIDRAALQSKIGTARLLHELMGSPPLPEGALGGPAYTLSASGTAFALEIGAQVVDNNGNRLAPVDVVLETDSRKPQAKHEILEMYVQHGLELPDTPVMALHRGRIDLLEEHLRRDPELLQRTFTHEEIYPPDLGCHDEVLATQGTPLAGTTLLHMCVDYDEIEIARWLLERGMDPNAKAAVDARWFRRAHSTVCHRRVAAELLDELTRASRRSRRLRSCCSIRARIRIFALRYEKSSIPDTRPDLIRTQLTNTGTSRRSDGAGSFMRKSSSANLQCS